MILVRRPVSFTDFILEFIRDFYSNSDYRTTERQTDKQTKAKNIIYLAKIININGITINTLATRIAYASI